MDELLPRVEPAAAAIGDIVESGDRASFMLARRIVDDPDGVDTSAPGYVDGYGIVVDQRTFRFLADSGTVLDIDEYGWTGKDGLDQVGVWLGDDMP